MKAGSTASGSVQRSVTSELLATLSVVARRWPNRLRHGQQFPAAGQVLGTVAIAEKSVMADALEAAWKDMEQETPQEIIPPQDHLFLPAPLRIRPIRSNYPFTSLRF